MPSFNDKGEYEFPDEMEMMDDEMVDPEEEVDDAFEEFDEI